MRRLAAVAVVTTLLAAACTGNGGGPQEPAEALITISAFSFGDPVTVVPGSRVSVVNRDGVAHTWTSVEGVFDSGVLDQNDDFSFVFERAGEYEFFCSIHPTMRGKMLVEG